jgi:hypothetical protein
MSASQPLLETIEADDQERPSSNAQQKTNIAPTRMAVAEGDAEQGMSFGTPPWMICYLNYAPRHCRNISSSTSRIVFEIVDQSFIQANGQSAHPMALFCLYFFRIAAITVYMISGWFGDFYVLTVRPVTYSILLIAPTFFARPC